MRVLGLDLGEHLGWAITEFDNGKWEYIEFGCKDLKNSPREKVDDPELRRRMWEHITPMITSKRITAVSVERVNPKTIKGNRQYELHYGYRGVAELAAALAGVRFVYCDVGSIKKRVTGNGAATKESMVAMIRRLGVATTNDNTADAVGVSLVAIDQIRIEERGDKKSKKPTQARRRRAQKVKCDAVPRDQKPTRGNAEGQHDGSPWRW